MAGREAAALRRQELSFSLAVGVEARRQRRRRQQRWRQCGGSVSRVAESGRQRRGDGGQHCCGVGSARVAVAAPRRRWQWRWQLSSSRQRGGRAARWQWWQRLQSPAVAAAGGRAALLMAALQREARWPRGGGSSSSRGSGSSWTAQHRRRWLAVRWQRNGGRNCCGSRCHHCAATARRPSDWGTSPFWLLSKVWGPCPWSCLRGKFPPPRPPRATEASGPWVIGRIICVLEFYISILNRVKVSNIGMVCVD